MINLEKLTWDGRNWKKKFKKKQFYLGNDPSTEGKLLAIEKLKKIVESASSNNFDDFQDDDDFEVKTTNNKGQVAIIKTELFAAKRGYVISKPTTDHNRYDLILDDGNGLKRVQVKYANGRSSIGSENVVRACLMKKHGKKILLYNKNEIDLLLVYIPKINKICAFGPEIFDNAKNLYIRIEPAKNNQIKGCLIANDYLWK